MRCWKFLLTFGLVLAIGLSMSGCATTEQDGVIIEQRRWWHIFSETEPAEEDAKEEYPS